MSEDKIKAMFVPLGKRLADLLDEDQWSECERLLLDGIAACAAIKDAEIAKLKTELAEKNNLGQPATGIYHEQYRNEIASRDLMIKKLREALEKAQQHLDYCGYGDSWEREVAKESKVEEVIEKALANSEHHNSRALDIKLLEARIDELKQLHSFTESTDGVTSNNLLRYINNAKAKLAELNKE